MTTVCRDVDRILVAELGSSKPVAGRGPVTPGPTSVVDPLPSFAPAPLQRQLPQSTAVTQRCVTAGKSSAWTVVEVLLRQIENLACDGYQRGSRWSMCRYLPLSGDCIPVSRLAQDDGDHHESEVLPCYHGDTYRALRSFSTSMCSLVKFPGRTLQRRGRQASPQGRREARVRPYWRQCPSTTGPELSPSEAVGRCCSVRLHIGLITSSGGVRRFSRLSRSLNRNFCRKVFHGCTATRF